MIQENGTFDNKYLVKDVYKPKNKKEREARRKVWERYEAMRDNPQRKEQEEIWDMADKQFAQYIAPREEGDWQSHIVLPDAFAGVQTYMQETIDRRSRPYLRPANKADDAVEQFVNSIMTCNMDKTGYDYQEFLSKTHAAIRGTSFRINYYRVDKRIVQDISGIKDDGNLEYTKKEITDFDDDYTEWVPSENILTDPSAVDVDSMRDFIRIEILPIEEFCRIYKDKPGFMNVDKVQPAGQVSDFRTAYFERPKDMTDDEVMILHYENRSFDEYFALANNVLIRCDPMPTKHKELSLIIDRHYVVPGSPWGLGIPKVIYSLTEERSSLRNMNIDKQHLQIDKVFLKNDLVDLDEDDMRVGPGKAISVNTNGLRLNEVIMPLEYGDVPPSYYQTENMLLEDIRRAHGINDQLQGNNVGGTATEAAILKEASQRRINLINVVSEMNSVIRIGKLKWSNIQFFYKAAKVEKITVDRETRIKKSYRSIRVEDKVFDVTTDPGSNRSVMKVNDYDGTSNFTLSPKYARYMDGDFDVIMDAEPHSAMSKPIKQAKITEMLNTLTMNPAFAAALDPKKAAKRYITINDEDPDHWLRDKGMTDQDWQLMAQHENSIMANGQSLPPTMDAPEAHTMEHLRYTSTVEFNNLEQGIQDLFMAHIMGEHDQNPNTGSAADVLQGAQAGIMGGAGNPTAPTGGTATPQADISLEPQSPAGQDQQENQQEAIAQ